MRHGRRRFLGTAAMTIAAAPLGILGRLRPECGWASFAETPAETGAVEANQRVPRELAAIGGAASGSIRRA